MNLVVLEVGVKLRQTAQGGWQHNSKRRRTRAKQGLMWKTGNEKIYALEHVITKYWTSAHVIRIK